MPWRIMDEMKSAATMKKKIVLVAWKNGSIMELGADDSSC